MTFSFAFGDSGDGPAVAMDSAIPLLRGDPREVVMADASPLGRDGTVILWHGPSGLGAIFQGDPAGDLAGATQRVYADILRAARGLNLYRIWNVVPRINEPGPGGMENYRAFCRGRSDAFEAGFGTGFQNRLPAASAVGSAHPQLTIAFVAGTDEARHFENPAQVPAYQYPPEHGPRSPSFARATVVERAASASTPTSRGPRPSPGTRPSRRTTPWASSPAPWRTCGSSRGACGPRRAPRLGGGWQLRHFKVFLRNASDLARWSPASWTGALVRGDRPRSATCGRTSAAPRSMWRSRSPCAGADRS